MLRTCEANKRSKKHRVFGSILVAPIRPFDAFGMDKNTGRPYHELIIEGFPDLEDPAKPPGQCLRFMALNPCEEHLTAGGIICFREMQPIPIRHLLSLEKITRLSIPTVGALDYRLAMYLQQEDEDNEKDAAEVGPESEIVAAYRRGKEKEAARKSS